MPGAQVVGDLCRVLLCVLDALEDLGFYLCGNMELICIKEGKFVEFGKKNNRWGGLRREKR